MTIDPNVVIDRLGGTSETARLFEIEPASVSGWRKLGIPKARLQFLRVARPDVLVLEAPSESVESLSGGRCACRCD
ncbi:hypothetical protein [Burkholderia sp. Ax-1724]|uniref:hypothetical protein n=1 Tax=Burkholderia sp. Ax-1724 TaxID=2608336 RepID=UPI001421FC5D|nr:hypothetical protein [Burkholderia sp. Ax-1724]NIF51431.1 hypothetical protein [Burkholderia sp. Ax-1724]